MNSLIASNKIQSITPTTSYFNNVANSSKQTKSSFANVLKSTLENVSKAELEADKMTEDLASGKAQDMHNVMIAAQKASITLEATVQIQSKAIDAYNEIMRMQV